MPDALTLTIRQPDDWHLHLRDDDYLPATVASTARCFGRAIIMPNLTPPITTIEQAEAYRQRIQQATPAQANFQPLMTLYLTETMPVATIKAAKASGIIHAVKLYPAGATTNSAAGVGNLEKIYPLLAEMEKQQLPLLIHGEVTDPDVDIFDREQVFIERDLTPIRQQFPALPIVLEHITTLHAVNFVLNHRDKTAATITVHHLRLNRNDMLVGGIRPHYYCLPILKRQQHQQSLIAAATSGYPQFFLGTDSAPHARHRKESSCGCAGVFSAPVAMELCAEIFEQHDALDKLENFTSQFGADFYQLPYNQQQITLVKRPWTVPGELPFGEHRIIPFAAEQQLTWSLAHDSA